MTMKIAAIGRTQMLHKCISALAESGFIISSIITAKAAPEYTMDENCFKELADKLDVPFVIANTLDSPEAIDALNGCSIGISINWPSIFKKEHIDLFKHGIINVHAGALPAYRGNACPNWAILKGDKEITVSAHFVEGDKLDCGRIVGQKSIPINDDTKIEAVYKWMESEIPLLVVDIMGVLSLNPHYVLKYADINAPESFRCWPRIPEDGFIDWNKSALEIHRLINASGYPFAGAYCYVKEADRLRKLIILDSRLTGTKTNDAAVPGQIMHNDIDTGASMVYCGNGEVLLITSCRYADSDITFQPGKCWKSIRKRLQFRLEDYLWQMTCYEDL